MGGGGGSGATTHTRQSLLLLPLLLPACTLQVVTAWNGQGISAFALAARTLPAEQPPPPPCFPVDGCEPEVYMQVSACLFVCVCVSVAVRLCL
jgi:hypothetical protein